MISKPPGIEDIFPDRIDKWNRITGAARKVFSGLNYRECILPVIEFTEVFSRGLGDETDIVSKEMFTFDDRGGRHLTLRPEGTASMVRAYVENGEFNRLASCKFFYMGPMFRAERPQRGRLRQFNQFGAEMFGSGDPYYDYEVMLIMDLLCRELGLRDYSLLVNSIGCSNCRGGFVDKLKDYYSGITDRLCGDCRKRLAKNPLRLLDCKNEQCEELKKAAPVIVDHVCEPCKDHHGKVKNYLGRNNIRHTDAPHLVRGLDYYTRTTFEFVTDKLGGQNAFAAGGRYDDLVERFGGKPTPAVGFAAGIERLFLLTGEIGDRRGIDFCLIHSGGETLQAAVGLMKIIAFHGFSAEIDPEKTGFKPQFKKADREKARYALVIGEEELSKGAFTVKDMKSGEQTSKMLGEIDAFLLSIKPIETSFGRSRS